MAIIGWGQALVLRGIKLIGDFADDLFENIFKRDQPFERSIFIDHQRKVTSAFQKLPHLIVKRRGIRHKIRLNGHVTNVKILQGGNRGFRVFHQRIHRP